MGKEQGKRHTAGSFQVPSKPLSPSQLRKQQRLLQKRILAKALRQRHKVHQIELETQLLRLTYELQHLHSVQTSACPAVLDTGFREELLGFMGKLRELMGSREAKEEEIEGVLREWNRRLGMGGGRRDELLKDTFRRTVGTMIPGHIAQAMALCDIAALPEFQSTLQAFPLTPSQQVAFQACQRLLQAQQSALQAALNSFGEVAESICLHTQVLQTWLLGFLPVLRPRQMAHLALWFCQRYADLSAEKVLDYGHCGTEVLNSG